MLPSGVEALTTAAGAAQPVILVAPGSRVGHWLDRDGALLCGRRGQRDAAKLGGRVVMWRPGLVTHCSACESALRGAGMAGHLHAVMHSERQAS